MYVPIEELGEEAIKEEYNSLCTNVILKDEHKHLKTKALTYVVDIPTKSHPH